MKKTFLFTTLLLVILGLKAMAGNNPVCYVKSGENTYFGQKLKFGINTVKIISNDGAVVKLPIKDVNSYRNGNRYFELRPTVNSYFETNGNALMELVKTRSDLKLYRCLKNDAGAPVYDYYVFKKECFHLLLNKENAANVLSFFGLEARVEL